MVRLKKSSNILINIRTFERAMGNRGHISKLINHYHTVMICLWYSKTRGGEEIMSGLYTVKYINKQYVKYLFQ